VWFLGPSSHDHWASVIQSYPPEIPLASPTRTHTLREPFRMKKLTDHDAYIAAAPETFHSQQSREQLPEPIHQGADGDD